ncbi:hypothetical protein [Cutibacterium sp.]|uniref:hypothetical protein n=1 Tax=Cutibacterium sp. TaxID=1912221 RepID=UPI0026DDA713|nr:hypothetical protein [Cutibacterium sp.]MDO4411705.1 hypothetical protein [Cutibacterium sp.]
MSLLAVCALALAGCAGGKEESKVPEGWVTDTVADFVEFAYPEDFDYPTPQFFGWTNAHASQNRSNYVAGNYSADFPEITAAQAQFVAQGLTANMALGKHEDLEINGRKTKAIDYTVTTNNFPGRVWFIQIDDTTVVSIAAFFEESRKADLDKVGESIRVLK